MEQREAMVSFQRRIQNFSLSFCKQFILFCSSQSKASSMCSTFWAHVQLINATESSILFAVDSIRVKPSRVLRLLHCSPFSIAMLLYRSVAIVLPKPSTNDARPTLPPRPWRPTVARLFWRRRRCVSAGATIPIPIPIPIPNFPLFSVS